MKGTLFTLATLGALISRSGDAAACGGPDYGDFSAVGPVTAPLHALLYPDDYADWGQQQRPEMRFLFPFWKAHPGEIDALYHVSYDGVTELPPPSTAKLDAAVAAHDAIHEAQEARAIVDAIYAMPPVPAAKHRALLARAVSVLEQLAGGSDPHAPSRAFDSLSDHLRQGIPDGWSADTSKKVPAAAWAALLAEVDRWLSKYPTHALADMVRLMRVRVYFFKGDPERAWAQAFALYPARRVRALAEMRYLLLQDERPSDSLMKSNGDLELAAALFSVDSPDSGSWPALWQRAEQAARGDVRTNLEERLLAWTATHGAPGSLPVGFPSRPDNPSVLWGKLRAISLMQAHEWDRAIDELTTLPDDADRALLSAQAEIQRGRAEQVAALPLLGEDGRRYVLGVLLDDAAVDRLCRSADPRVRDPACLERAVRFASTGNWKEGAALVQKVRPTSAALWHRAEQLAANPNGALAFARFLDQSSRQLLFGFDNGPYRGASDREAQLPAGSPEKAAIGDMLRRSSERWLALEAYTRWLVGHSGAANALDVLGEADDAYNWLVNVGGGNTFFFGRSVPSSSTAKELRQVGAIIRARAHR
jgi:hypothetical protein